LSPAPDGPMRIRVISPTRAVFDGGAESVVAPAHDGEVGILRGHAPMVTLLGEGVVTVRGGGETQEFQVSRGFLQVLNDDVTVLAEQAAPL